MHLLEQDGATYGPRATSGPRVCFYSLNWHILLESGPQDTYIGPYWPTSKNSCPPLFLRLPLKKNSANHTERFKDFDKFNLVKFVCVGLFLRLIHCTCWYCLSCLQNDSRFKSGQKRHKNNHLDSLVLIHDTLCLTQFQHFKNQSKLFSPTLLILTVDMWLLSYLKWVFWTAVVVDRRL